MNIAHNCASFLPLTFSIKALCNHPLYFQCHHPVTQSEHEGTARFRHIHTHPGTPYLYLPLAPVASGLRAATIVSCQLGDCSLVCKNDFVDHIQPWFYLHVHVCILLSLLETWFQDFRILMEKSKSVASAEACFTLTSWENTSQVKKHSHWQMLDWHTQLTLTPKAPELLFLCSAEQFLQLFFSNYSVINPL